MPIEPPVRGMTVTDALPAYMEPKLFTLNCGHAITACLSFAHGLDRIDQALAHTAILLDLRARWRMQRRSVRAETRVRREGV